MNNVLASREVSQNSHLHMTSEVLVDHPLLGPRYFLQPSTFCEQPLKFRKSIYHKRRPLFYECPVQVFQHRRQHWLRKWIEKVDHQRSGGKAEFARIHAETFYG